MKKFFLATCVVALLLSLLGATAKAQTKESPWQEVQVVEIPFGLQVHEGVTRNGNPKFWFEFAEIGNVSVSPSSAEKYTEKSTVLVLIKWQNKETQKLRYSIRQKDSSRGSSKPNIDLAGLFK